MDKVKLPKETASILDSLIDSGYNNRAIIVEKLHREGERQQDKFTQFPMDVILQALVNGYEVEETPEDKVKKYYEELGKNPFLSANDRNVHRAIVRNTLNRLGKKIVGVNHD